MMMTLPSDAITHARVLVVEDEAIVAMDLQSRVEALGHTVVGTAASVEAALRRAGETRPQLTLMDIQLKGPGDGIGAAEEIRRRHNCPVVFLSAFTDSDTIAKATATEPFGYLVKPIDDRELDLAIRVALRRHAAEQRVKGAERWLSTTLTSLGDAVVSTDLDGRVTFMNALAEALTGWELEGARGRDIDEVLSREAAPETPVDSPIRRALAEGVVSDPDGRAWLVNRHGGRTPIYETAAPIRDEQGQVAGLVVVFRDARVRRRAGRGAGLFEMSDAAAPDGAVAHEFNSLMAAVLGTSGRMLDDPRLPDVFREPLGDIRHAADRAVMLTQQHLTSGGGSAGPAMVGTALLVDDEPNLRRRLASVLRRAGLTVIEAADAQSALGLARAHAGDLDLLITDALTRTGSGTELVRQVSAMRPCVKTLLTGGFAGSAMPPQVQGVPVPRILYKPFLPAELIACVRELLGPEAGSRT